MLCDAYLIHGECVWQYVRDWSEVCVTLIALLTPAIALSLCLSACPTAAPSPVGCLLWVDHPLLRLALVVAALSPSELSFITHELYTSRPFTNQCVMGKQTRRTRASNRIRRSPLAGRGFLNQREGDGTRAGLSERGTKGTTQERDQERQ